MYTTPLSFEEYLKPKTIEEAVSFLARCGKEAKLLAGGTDLLNLVRNGALMPKWVIDIAEIPELDYVRVDETGSLRIGALATLKVVGQSQVVTEGWPIICEAIRRMGMTQLRNMGTVVGNICRASPSADSASTLLVLDAVVEIKGPGKSRNVPLGEFFTGPGMTVLNDDEMVTGISVPKLPAGAGTAFLKQTRVAEDLAKVNVATLVVRQNGVCKEARIGLGGVAPTPMRAREAEEILRGKQLDDKLLEQAAKEAADETKPITDLRSTAEYRKELSKVLVGRAIKIAWERTQGKKGG
jgi:carbon-monoxide dehydrogenase medium subunit